MLQLASLPLLPCSQPYLLIDHGGPRACLAGESLTLGPQTTLDRWVPTSLGTQPNPSHPCLLVSIRPQIPQVLPSSAYLSRPLIPCGLSPPPREPRQLPLLVQPSHPCLLVTQDLLPPAAPPLPPDQRTVVRRAGFGVCAQPLGSTWCS